jgi:hypothetical protein
MDSNERGGNLMKANSFKNDFDDDFFKPVYNDSLNSNMMRG